MQPRLDDSLPPPPRREPVFNLPTVLVVVIAALVLIHAGLELAGPERSFRTIVQLGFVPAAWTVRLDEEALRAVAERALAAGDMIAASREIAFARYALANGADGPWTFLTYAGLHGSWLHLGINCVWLAAFGAPVARRCGTARFLALAAVAAVAGALAHWATHAYDVTPMIGASGAVSGLMAAAIRFAFPGRRPAWEWPPVPPHLGPRLSLAGILSHRTALTFIGVWLVLNLVFGLAAAPLGLAEGGVAWEAHLGGFLAGLLLFPLFDPVRAPRAVA